ncbi:Rho termination factor-like protein [Motilibacter peucedani]|uniref:Rho termination factor-like protein n=1 Tax=Motilibacter peucedani TaxID=598650 RepID=A0A420XQN1_9ACTN|nr:hemerythrin domain-containing protein [Motilibacter peucedani]RKS75618.1 Rho termination factor-like protein [Motilibacter peucedani]
MANSDSTRDVVQVIKAQHREIDALLDQASEEDSDTLPLLQKVAALLIPHSKAEEGFVYPAIEARDPQEGDEVKDGAAEHHHIEAMLQELLTEDPDGPGYDGKLAAMVGELRHHVEEEESELLPALEEGSSAEDLRAMGERFAAETGWSGPSGEGASGDGGSTDGATKEELYEKAKELDVAGRSSMSKQELARAVDEA